MTNVHDKVKIAAHIQFSCFKFQIKLKYYVYTFHTQLMTYGNVLLDLKITPLCVIQHNKKLYILYDLYTYITIYYDSIILVFEYFRIIYKI